MSNIDQLTNDIEKINGLQAITLINSIPYQLTAVAGPAGLEFHYRGSDNQEIKTIEEARETMTANLGLNSLVHTTGPALGNLSNLTGLTSAPAASAPRPRKTFSQALQTAAQPHVGKAFLDTLGLLSETGLQTVQDQCLLHQFTNDIIREQNQLWEYAQPRGPVCMAISAKMDRTYY